MMQRWVVAGLLAAVPCAMAQAAEPAWQILAAKCTGCHGGDEPKSGLRLDSLVNAQKGGKSGKAAIVPYNLNSSEIVSRITRPADAEGAMPPKEPRLTAEETVAVINWIVEGAPWDANAPAPAPAPAEPAPAPALLPGETDFSKEVLPIFQARCIECHGEEKQKSGLRLDTYENVLKGAELGPVVLAGKADESTLCKLIHLAADDDDIMPPKGDPLTDAQKAVIVKWIDEGAKPGTPIIVVEKKPDILEVLAKEVQPAAAEAIEAVRQTGALVLPLDQKSPLLRVDYSLQADTADDKLAALAGVSDQITWLNLANTKVTDAGLAQIAGLKNLTALHLEKTGVSDAALAHLAGMPHLKYLNLYATQVSDAGIDHLTGLKSLERVYLWQSKATQAGADKLAAAVPEVEVNLGSELKIVDLEAEKKKTEEALAKLKPFFDEGGCCATAAADGKLCDHDCCKEAAKEGKVCAKCNPKGAEAQAAAAEKPEPEKVDLSAFFDEGGCCAKAKAEGKACDHPCCVEAAAAGKVCAKCNPKGAEKQASAAEPATVDLAAYFDEGGCCAKAKEGGADCTHPCCVEAAKAGKVCEKCNPKGAAKLAAEKAA